MNLTSLTNPVLAAIVRGFAMAHPTFVPVADEVSRRLCANAERAKANRPSAHGVGTELVLGTNGARMEGGLGGGRCEGKEPLVSQKRGSEPESEEKKPELRAEPERNSTNSVRTHPHPPIPPLLNTPEFAAAWAEWKQYRSGKGKPVSARAAAKQLAKCDKWGPAVAVIAINEAISNDWQGLFEPKEQANGRKPVPDHRAARTAREFAEPGLLDSIPTYRPGAAGTVTGQDGAGARPSP